MADFLPPAVQKFIADVEQYVDPIKKAERETEQFSREVEKAGIAADKAMGKAADAAKKAEVAQRAAADAAQKLAKGEIDVDEASKAAAEAVDKVTRADLANREAAIAAANAADKQADQYRQMARDAAMADAAVYVANVKASGSALQHKRAVEEVTKVFPELKKSASEAFKVVESQGNRAFQMLEKAGESLASVGPLWIVAIVNAIAMLPQIAAVAGGAITLALGGALTAVGVMFALKNKAIRDDFASLGKSITSTMERLTKPFQGTMIEIAKAAADAGRSIEGSLGGAFDEIAPSVSNFAHYLATSFDKLNPMIRSLGQAFAKLLDDMGPRLPQIMNNIGTGFKAIFDAISKNPGALTNFIVGISQFIRVIGDGIGILIRFKDQFKLLIEMASGGGPLGLLDFISKAKSAFDSLFGSGQSLKSQIGQTGQQFVTFGHQTDAVSTGMAEAKAKADPLTQALRNQKAGADAVTQAFNKMTGAFESSIQAEINVQQAIDDTTKALKTNGKTLDLTTQKGRDNMGQLIADAHAYQDKIAAMKNSGATATQISKEEEYLRKVFIAQAYAMTGNIKTAKTLADRLLGIAAASKKIPRKITQDIYQVMHLTTTQAYLNKRKNILGYAHGGEVKGYADGGSIGGTVSGVGTETSDSIIAFLSKNEFVVNAKQAKKHKALLEAINSGVAGFANGGRVGGVITGGGYMHLQKIVQDTYKKNAKKAHFTGNKTAEYAASHAAAAVIQNLRKGPVAAWSMHAGIGSNPSAGVITQHTSVNLYVAGSVRSDRDLEEIIQQVILQRNLRNPTSGVNLPAGRVGSA